jgi:hypothetical protein
MEYVFFEELHNHTRNQLFSYFSDNFNQRIGETIILEKEEYKTLESGEMVPYSVTRYLKIVDIETKCEMKRCGVARLRQTINIILKENKKLNKKIK